MLEGAFVLVGGLGAGFLSLVLLEKKGISISHTWLRVTVSVSLLALILYVILHFPFTCVLH